MVQIKKKLTPQEKAAKVVGPVLAEVLPQTDQWWFQQPHLLRLNLLLAIPMLSSSVSGFDGSLMNGLQSLEQWSTEFGNPTGSILGLVNACLNIGNLAALPLVPWLADRFGRNLPIAVGAAGTMAATVVQCCAPDYATFCLARALLGFFSGLMISPSALLIAETAYPTHRGKLTSVYFTVYYAGSIVASWVTFGCRDLPGSLAWQVPSAFQAALPALQLALLWLVPRSPRWLVAQDRVAEAAALLRTYHDPPSPPPSAPAPQSSPPPACSTAASTDAVNGSSAAAGRREEREEDQEATPSPVAEASPLVARELSEIVESIQLERAAASTTYAALLATPGNRRRLMISVMVGFFAQWNGITVLSYYLTLVLSSVGITGTFDQTLINGMLQIFNFAAAVVGALLVDRLGRRTLFIWSTAGMCVGYVVWTACSGVYAVDGNDQAAMVVVVMLFVIYFHYDIAWTPLLIAYPTEIFPYSLRAKGLAIEFYFNSGGLIIAQFANPLGIEALKWKYYIVFACILFALTIAIYFLFPETKGTTLEEIAVIFDGLTATIGGGQTADKNVVEQVEFKEV